jgi:hypothetical protein
VRSGSEPFAVASYVAQHPVKLHYVCVRLNSMGNYFSKFYYSTVYAILVSVLSADFGLQKPWRLEAANHPSST